MRRRTLVSEKWTSYNLVVTDNLNGASGATTNATITVKYTLNNVETTLGTNYKNGDTFLIPNKATNVTVTGSSITNYAPNVTVSDTTYTVNYRTSKVTVTISNGGTGYTVTLKNDTKKTTINSGTSTFSGYVPWGDKWYVIGTVTTSKYPTISTSAEYANSVNQSTTVTYINYTLVTDGAADLGLPSGKLWSAKNVGASNYYSEGNYFSWGNTDGHAKNSGYNFSLANYNNTIGASLTGDIPINATYDAARANMGSPWRIPTKTEYEELGSEANTIVCGATFNGMAGSLIVSKSNAKGIFFPKAGSIEYTTVYGYGKRAKYWTSTYKSSTGACCCELFSHGETYEVFNVNNTYSKFNGFTIRAIKDPT